MIHPGIGAPTVRKNYPRTYYGKAAVDRWVSHMTNYLCGAPAHDMLLIAVSYLTYQVHKWHLAYSQHAQLPLNDWAALGTALIDCLRSRNKLKLAIDKLSVWNQVKDIELEQWLLFHYHRYPWHHVRKTYRQSWVLKPYFCKELCAMRRHT